MSRLGSSSDGTDVRLATDSGSYYRGSTTHRNSPQRQQHRQQQQQRQQQRQQQSKASPRSRTTPSGYAPTSLTTSAAAPGFGYSRGIAAGSSSNSRIHSYTQRMVSMYSSRRMVALLIACVLGFIVFNVWGQADLTNHMQRYTELNNTNDITALHQQISDLQARIKALENSHKKYSEVKFLSYKDRKRILITGGAGFVGSHLVDKLMLAGHEVTVMDNFFTGRKRNIEHWLGHENFELINHDVVNPLFIEVDQIYHLASPASPPHYMYNPIKTIKTNTVGTINMLGLAKRVRARLLLASTSEVYGDPEIHPQTEEYWGHVNPIGPRACYDEGKRVAETMCYAYNKQDGVEVRVARIFNTFGPRMHMADGRVVSNFILQSLQNKDITIYGDGSQTRSFQYVTDLVNGLVALMNSNYSQPVNLGNPEEYSMQEFAVLIKDMAGGSSEIVHRPAMQDDPRRRKPDISRAKQYIGWEPKIPMKYGINKTIEYFRNELQRTSHSERNIWHPDMAEQDLQRHLRK